MLQGHISRDKAQALRSVTKGIPHSAVPPVTPDDILHVDTIVDPETRKDVVMWEDILQAFDNAVQVRHKTRVVPFLKGSNLRMLVPHLTIIHLTIAYWEEVRATYIVFFLSMKHNT
jgi:hypothetical protein